MKKILIVLIAAFMLLPMTVNAISNYAVYSDDVVLNQGDVVSIPVKLEKNNGIMGFRITLKYSENVFESPIVKKGTITSQGIINDSIDDKTRNTFDVLWSNTENVVEDGILFWVEFKVSESAPLGVSKIKISYTQEDTFDETMSDVKLICTDINVDVKDENSTISNQQENFFVVVWNAIVSFFRWVFGLFA